MAELALAQKTLESLVNKVQNEIVRLYQHHYNLETIKQIVLAVLDQIHDDTKALRQVDFKTARDLTILWQKRSVEHIASPTSIKDLGSIRFHASRAINIVTDPMDKLVAIGMLIHATFHYTVLSCVTRTTTTTATASVDHGTDGGDNGNNNRPPMIYSVLSIVAASAATAGGDGTAPIDGSSRLPLLDATTSSPEYLQAKKEAQQMFEFYVQDFEALKSAAEEEMVTGLIIRLRKRRAFGDKEKRRKLLLQFARLGHSVFILPPCTPACNDQHPRFPELEKAVEKVSRNRHAALHAPALPIIDGPYCYGTLSGHSSFVLCCVVFDNGRQLASGSRDNTIKLWDLGTGQCKRTLKGHDGEIWCCAVFDDGRQLVSGSEDNSLKVWDLDAGECKRTLTGHIAGIMFCAVFDDGRQLVSGSVDKTIKVWDLVGAGSECTRTLQGNTVCCAVFDKGQKLASGSPDMTINLWDLVGRTAGKECVHTLKGHTGVIFCLVVFDEGRQLASGSSDNTIRVWDLVGGTTAGPKCTRTLKGHDDTVHCCAVFDEGRHLVSVSDDRTIKLWDLGTGHCMHTLKGHTSWVRCCSVSDDGRQFASGSWDCTIKLWDLSNRSS